MVTTTAHFTDSAVAGGAERVMLHLLSGLDRRRWRPILLYHESPGIMTVVDEARRRGVEVMSVVPLPEGRVGAARVPAFMRLLLRLRPAVFHAHLTWPLACKLALISAIAARVPATIGTIHLYVDSSWTPWQRLQHHGITRGIGRYIAVSNGVAEKLRRELSVPLDKIRVVPNGVPLTMPPVGNGTRAVSPRRRLRAALGIHDAAPLVLIPGRLERQKGHCYALEAARSLPGVIFLLAGEGTERAPLEAQASRLGVGDRIRFLGHRQDLPDLLVACDIVCLPSLFEGLPLALLEAMVAGKPIVSTAIPGVDEAVVDGETGLLVPPADPHALESAIRRLMVDPNLAQNLGVAGRARAERFFSIGAMIEGVTRAYDELLAPERNSHGR